MNPLKAVPVIALLTAASLARAASDVFVKAAHKVQAL